MPVPEFMKTVKVGRVAHITIDHPPLNTSNTEILQELARDVLKYEADGSVCVILLDSANQKSSFAADGAALFAKPWLASAVRNVARGSARAHRDRILVKASHHGNLRRGLHGRRLGASADFSYFERLAAANYLRFPRRPLAQCRDGTTLKGSSIISAAPRRSSSL